MLRSIVVASVLAVGFFTQSVSATSAGKVPRVSQMVHWGSLEDALFAENQTLQGSLNERNTWNSYFCSSAFYTYNLGIKAVLSDVKLGLQEDGSVTATARFDSVMGKALGSLQNAGTFCHELKANVGLGIEWAEVSANVSFGTSGTLDELAVQVTDTRLGKLDMGKYFPDWFESMVTGIANRGLKYMWQSQLGGFLNRKITEIVKRQIPEKRVN